MKALITWRKRNFLRCDLAFATIAAVVALAILHNAFRTVQLVHFLDGGRTTLYGTASAGCAALLGFVITTTTITDAVMQNPQWAAFRKSFAYSQVQDIYFDTIRWLGAGTLVFLVLLVADTDAHPLLLCEAASAWLASVLTVRMWRSISALETLLRMNSFKLKSPALLQPDDA